MTLFFQRGAIDAEHLPFVLRLLPVDVSFADEDDILRYWSGVTYRTCDPHFIGQDIRACHPGKSLEVLETDPAGVSQRRARDRRRLAQRGRHVPLHALHRRARQRRRVPRHPRGDQDLTDARGLSGEQALPGW